MSTEYRVVPLAFLEELASSAGTMVNGNQLSAKAAEIIAAPVPPAGGEPEVLRYCMHNNDGKLSVLPDAKGYWCKHDDVARLQVEVAGLNLQLENFGEDIGQLNSETSDLEGECDALRAELAKAREIIKHGISEIGFLSHASLYREMEDFLANQSAPAAKDDLVWCDSCPTSGGCVNSRMKMKPRPTHTGDSCIYCGGTGVLSKGIWSVGEPDSFDCDVCSGTGKVKP